MKCVFVATDETHKSGRPLLRCKRGGCKSFGVMPPSGNPESLVFDGCTGRLRATDYREAITAIMEGLGVHKAAAIVHYIRWRAKGSPLSELPPGVPSPHVAAPNAGPGTELKKILSELGITSQKCPGYCQEWIDRMNTWGVEGCRAHRGEIMAHLNEAYATADLATKIEALGLAVLKGLPKTLAGLLDLAIERAR